MKSIKFRDLKKTLKKHDDRFQFLKNKGKGSHRMIVHADVNGKRASFPIPLHGNDGDIKKPYLKNIVRRFDLPKDIFD